MTGLRLKEIRKKHKYTQEDLAKITDTTSKTVLTYEKSLSTIPSSFLEKISALGFDVQYIITGVRSESSPLTPIQKQLLTLFEEASTEMQKACLAMLLSGSKQGTTFNINNVDTINVK